MNPTTAFPLTDWHHFKKPSEDFPYSPVAQSFITQSDAHASSVGTDSDKDGDGSNDFDTQCQWASALLLYRDAVDLKFLGPFLKTYYPGQEFEARALNSYDTWRKVLRNKSTFKFYWNCLRNIELLNTVDSCEDLESLLQHDYMGIQGFACPAEEIQSVASILLDTMRLSRSQKEAELFFMNNSESNNQRLQVATTADSFPPILPPVNLTSFSLGPIVESLSANISNQNLLGYLPEVAPALSQSGQGTAAKGWLMSASDHFGHDAGFNVSSGLSKRRNPGTLNVLGSSSSQGLRSLQSRHQTPGNVTPSEGSSSSSRDLRRQGVIFPDKVSWDLMEAGAADSQSSEVA